TDRCHRRGHDVPYQDLRWVPSGRRDLPQDIAVGDQADGSAILDNNETTDLLRRHPLRRIQDRPFGIDYDDAFRHHVPNEDHAEPRGPCGSHPGRYRSCLGQRATYQSMKASNVRTSQLLRGRRSGSRQDLDPRFLLLPWEALAERIQPQSVLAGRVFRTTEEGPSVPGATPHETAFRAHGAGPVVLLQERRVSDPSTEGGPMRLQFRHDGVERTPRFCHHVLESRMAFRNRRHAFLQMAGHLRTRDVGAIDGQGVHEGPSRGGRSHGAAGDELPAEEQIQDLMTRRLRAEFEALHRQEEGPLRVERRGFGSVFDYPDLL